MPTNFSNIGFKISFAGYNNQQIIMLLTTLFKKKYKAISVKNKISRKTDCFLTSDSSGAQIYWYTENERFIDVAPGFNGNIKQLVKKVKNIKIKNTGFEKCVSLWVYSEKDIGYPLNVALPAYYLENYKHLSKLEQIQITLFANTLECYKNQEEFNKVYPKNEEGNQIPSSGMFIPTGTFSPSNDPNFEPSTECLCYGKVVSAEKLTNKIGGGDFWHIILDTYAAKYDVVADAELLKEEPKEGEIIGGSFYVSGRLDNGPNKPAELSKFIKTMITVAATVAIATLLKYLQ